MGASRFIALTIFGRVLLWVLLVAATQATKAEATLYQCVDASGSRVFTDSLAQLKDCKVMNPGGPNPPASSSVHTPPVSSPSPQPPLTRPPGPPAGIGGAVTSQPHGESGTGAGPGPVAAPLERVGRSLVVQVRLNGTRQAKLILDTGADITILSHAVALDLGLVPTASSPTITLNTVGGTVRADVVVVETMALGGAEAKAIQAAIHDLPDAPPGVDGLLGLTFLDKFLVTVDSQKGELHLQPRP